MKTALTALLCLIANLPNLSYAACQQGSNYYPHVVESGYGTVLEARTGLEWQQCSIGQGWSGNSAAAPGKTCDGEASLYPWSDKRGKGALDIAPTNRFADFNDWRLPTREEWLAIVDPGCKAPALTPLIAGDSNWHWSSTPLTTNPNSSWGLDFGSGEVLDYNRATPGAVRLVRPSPWLLPPIQGDAITANQKRIAVLQTLPPWQRVALWLLPANQRTAFLALPENQRQAQAATRLLPEVQRATFLALPQTQRGTFLLLSPIQRSQFLALPPNQRIRFLSLPTGWREGLLFLPQSLWPAFFELPQSQKQILSTYGQDLPFLYAIKGESKKNWREQVQADTDVRLQAWLTLHPASQSIDTLLPNFTPNAIPIREKFETNVEYEARLAAANRRKNSDAPEEAKSPTQSASASVGQATNDVSLMRTALASLATAEALDQVKKNFPAFLAEARLLEPVINPENGDLILRVESGGKSLGRFWIKSASRDLRQASFNYYSTAKIHFNYDYAGEGRFEIWKMTIDLVDREPKWIIEALPMNQEFISPE